jgi:glutathione S-transferase
MSELKHPVLYSFRRCPYAMRARMGLYKAGIKLELREIVLRDKPEHMLEISPKGTVPVLQLTDGKVLEESLEILLWALKQHDPDGWLDNKDSALSLIKTNDTGFKYALDRYKYPNRYPDEDCSGMRERGMEILKDWNSRIENNGYLNGAKISLADIAIFPFVRQYAHTDRDWFDAQDIKPLQMWLETHKNSALFKAIMEKFELWSPGQDPVIWPQSAV